MASAGTKRKATSSLEEATKKLRLATTDSAVNPPSIDLKAEAEPDAEPDEDQSYRSQEDSSNNGTGANTPVTPFSPAPREKFPSEYKTLRCTFSGCNKTFNRPSRLDSHMKTHTNERTFTCEYEGCDKAYFEKKHLDSHIKSSHKKEKKYDCEWEGCGKSFLTNTRLKRHMETHKGQDRFVCTGYPGCNQVFRKHQTLQRHIRSDHMQLAPFPCPFIDPVTGVQCGSGFEGPTALKLHQKRVHESPFLCTKCVIPGAFKPDGTPINLGFTTENQLNNHIQKEHSNRNCCAFCDKKFARKQDLHSHVESQHSGKSIEERKRFKCQYTNCNKGFTKQYNLMVHIRSTHEGARFICGTFDVSDISDLAGFNKEKACGQDYATKANLENHIRTAHLGLSWKAVVARKNQKPAERDIVDFIDDDDEPEHSEDQDYDMLDIVPEKKQKKTKRSSRKVKPSVIDELIGRSYDYDPKRTILCLVPGCPHKFIRDYDLDLHMNSVHSDYNPFTKSTNNEFDTTLFEETILPQGDNATSMAPELSAPLQEQENWSLDFDQPDEAFWFGGGEFTPAQTPGRDLQWTHEEAEMRNLIGTTTATTGLGNDGKIGDANQLLDLDPALMGL